MVPIQLGFYDFSSFENYVRLQNTFLTKDANYDGHEELYSPIDGLQIKRPILGDAAFMLDPDAEMEDVDFEKDFLLTEIPKMSKYYYERILKKAKKANRYTPDELKYFIMHVLEGLNQYLELFSEADYLPEGIKQLLIGMAMDLSDKLNSYITNPYPGIKTKLPMKCKREDVLFFFHCLRENKVIKDISQADLVRIIENVFEFWDEQENIFKPITSSKQVLSEYNKPHGGKNANPSATRLTELFSSDFFNI